MPFSQKLLIMFTPVQLLVITIAIFVSTAVFGILIFRSILSIARLKSHNDVAGPVLGVIGTIYAVILAFVVIATWESHDAAKEHIQSEVSALVSLFAMAESFDQPVRSEIMGAIIEYVRSVVNTEWDGLKTGSSTSFLESPLNKLTKIYAAYNPTRMSEEKALEESMENLSDVIGLRRTRQLDARIGIHPMLWAILLLGGFITILMSCTFGADSLGLQMVMSTFLAILISIILFTIVQLDYPFTGRMRLSPQPFTEIAERLQGHIS